MTAFTIPYYDEPLIKASVKSKPLKKKNLGSWQGLKILEVGPLGGKIIGHDSKGKPIYAGGDKAKSLAKQKKAEVKDVEDWLKTLGFPNKIMSGHVRVSAAAADMLAEQFGVKKIVVKGYSAVAFKLADLHAHVGEPLKPKPEEHQAWAAGIASGEHEDDPFPDLDSLKQIPAGKYAGSHGNLLFEDAQGKKWIFKGEDPTIARAEEAACRIGRLILGDKVPPAKHVEIQGKSGVLLGELEGSPFNENHTAGAPAGILKKHAKQIAMHSVVDWLTSNHDGHSGNFLLDQTSVHGIDKGQAWKFFGDDKLHKDYSPNNSDAIYVKFWNAVQAGSLPVLDVLAGLEEAIAKAETITENQFRSIIAPYVSTAAGHVGFDPEEKAAAMTQRLKTLRDDFQTFIANLTGSSVVLQKPEGQDNFETMPEAEGTGGEKLTIKVPDKPKVIEGGAAEAIPDKPKAPGWPATEGQVTIVHPGEPSPGGKWPKGYPGAGFNASITYKKKKYTVEFLEAANNEIAVRVFYPDGTDQIWDSPSKASDSMFLWDKGLPLDMSSTAKRNYIDPKTGKKKGISLPAKKAFGITAFKEELAKAHAGEIPDSAKSPEQLEEAKVIEPGQKELSAKATVAAMYDGPLDDWAGLPHEILEALEAWDFPIGKNYNHAIPPGLPVKVTEEGEPVVYVAKKDSDGEVHYQAFEWSGDKLIHNPQDPATIDVGHALEGHPMLQGLIKEMKADIPETAEEKIGTPPPAELPETAVVPPEAPKHHKGPVPDGTSITVKKKFPWGKSEVSLHVSNEGKSFQVIMPTGSEADLDVQTFDSIAAASDFVWVNQKGYQDAAEYKAAHPEKKNKVPSGGGWKFWGIKTGKAPPPPPVPKTVPGMANLETFPTNEKLKSYPEGTVVIWQAGGFALKIKKKAGDQWDWTGPGGMKETYSSSEFGAGETAENIKIKLGTPAHWEPLPGATPPVANWQWFDAWQDYLDYKKAEVLSAAPVGAKIQAEFKADVVLNETGVPGVTKVYAEKDVNGKWGIHDSNTQDPLNIGWASASVVSMFNQAVSGIQAVGIPQAGVGGEPAPNPTLDKYADPLEGMPTVWEPVGAAVTSDFLIAQPEGTQLKAGGQHYVKSNGPTIWQNVETGDPHFTGVFLEKLEGHDVTMRVLDVEKFAAQQKEGHTPGTWKSLDAPPAVEELASATQGTKYKFHNIVTKTTAVAVKMSSGDWNLEPGDTILADSDLWGGIGAGFKKVGSLEKYIPLEGQYAAPAGEAPTEANWETLTDPDIYDMGAYSAGTKIQTTGYDGNVYLSEKVGEDNWSMTKEGWSGPLTFTNGEMVAEIKASASAKVATLTPVEANWETMPESADTDSKIGDWIAAQPVGSEFKFTTESGKPWTAVKTGEVSYEMTAPTGKVHPKSEVGFALFLMDKKNVVVQKEGAPFDPLAAILAGGPAPKKVTTDVEALPGHVTLAVADMKPGDKLAWEEHGSHYYIEKGPEFWSTHNADGTNIGEPEQTDEEALGYISWSSDPKDFKLTAEKVEPSEPTAKEVVEADVTESKLMGYPLGTQITYHDPDFNGPATAVKDEGQWKVTNENSGQVFFVGSAALGNDVQKTYAQGHPAKLTLPGDAAPEPAPPAAPAVPMVKVNAPKKPTAKFVGGFPVGSTFHLHGSSDVHWTKHESGWHHANDTNLEMPNDDAQVLKYMKEDIQTHFMAPEGSAPAKKQQAATKKAVAAAKKKQAEKTKEQKAKIEHAKKVAEWLKDNPGLGDPKALIALAHFQDLFELHKTDMKAWARSSTKGHMLLGSPSPEFAGLMADMEKTQGLKTTQVDTPLGTFWKVKTTDLADALPGKPADTVEGPDGKSYPKGTTWKEETTETSVKELLPGEPGFYKIKDHKSDPETKVLKVSGTADEKKAQLLAMADKHGLSHGDPVKGGSNWLLFVKTKELEKVGKKETTWDATVPKQPPPFVSAPYPTMGMAKPGQEGVSSPEDLANLEAMDLGKLGHAVRMGAAGTFKNGQVFARKVKDADGKEHYEVYGEVAARWNAGNAVGLTQQMSMSVPSSMTKDNKDSPESAFKLHAFEDGMHDEGGPNGGSIVTVNGFAGTTDSGADVRIYTERESFKDNFRVRVPVGGDVTTAVNEAFTMLGLDPEAATRQHTDEDERILKKHAIVKGYMGPAGWVKQGGPLDYSQAWDEAYLDSKLASLGIGEEVVASARFQTTYDNYQSVLIDDEVAKKPGKVKFIYNGNSRDGAFYQVLEGSGHASRLNRNLNGIDQTGASAGSDINSGGANGVMMRMGTTANKGGWGLKCDSSRYLAVYHPRMLHRTDWRLYKDDSYGHVDYVHGNAVARTGTQGYMASDGDNEILFDNGVSVRDQVGILAPDAYDREALIARFKQHGISEVNGIAIEDFVQVREGNSRAKNAKKLVGLQKGKLP